MTRPDTISPPPAESQSLPVITEWHTQYVDSVPTPFYASDIKCQADIKEIVRSLADKSYVLVPREELDSLLKHSSHFIGHEGRDHFPKEVAMYLVRWLGDKEGTR